MKKPPTMRDVAQAARVSQRTVSNVVNNYEHVAPQTRQRVTEAIEALGYRPNVAAQRLRTGKTQIIALAIPNVSWPYFGQIAHRIQAEAQRRGYTLLVAETEGTIEHELNVLKGFNTHVIDGLILSPIEAEARHIEDLKGELPIVLIGERIRNAGVPHFEVDGHRAGEEVSKHLFEQGAQTFLILGATATRMTLGPGPTRQAGFRAGLTQCGVPGHNIFLAEDSPWTYRGGYRAIKRWLTKNPLPDAIIAMNDIMAVGAVRALADAGLSVPGDVLVTGWDDVPDAAYSVPSLTTIRPNKQEIAERSVAALIRSIENDPEPGGDYKIEHSLVVRESTGGQQSRHRIGTEEDAVSAVGPTL